MGLVELTVVIIIVGLVFGAGKLPALGDGLGRLVKAVRRKPASPDASGKPLEPGQPAK